MSGIHVDGTKASAPADRHPSRGERREPDGRVRGVRALGGDAIAWVRSHPVALVAATLVLVANIIRIGIRIVHHEHVWSQSIYGRLSLLFPHGWDTIGSLRHHPLIPSDKGDMTQLLHMASSIVFVRSLSALIIGVVALFVVLALAETRLGAARTIVVSLASTIIGIALGLGLSILVSDHVTFGNWMREMPVRFSPIILAAGPLMASAYRAPLLHRRRILTIGYTAIFSTLLFAGNPSDYCLLATAVIGQIWGIVSSRNLVPAISWSRGTDHEIRRLLSYLQLALALGPLVAMTSQSHAGALTRLGLLLSTDDGTSMLDQCLSSQTARSCATMIGLRHAATAGMWMRLLLPMAVMVVIAWGIHRGRRLAAVLGVIANSSLAFFAALYYLTPLGVDDHLPRSAGTIAMSLLTTVIPTLFIAVTTALSMRRFTIATNPGKARMGGAIVAVSVLAMCLAFSLYAMAFPSSFTPPASPGLILLAMAHLVLPLNLDGLFHSALLPTTPLASGVTQVVGLIPWAALLAVLLWLLNDVARADEDSRVLADALIMRGGNSMGFMTTWEGNRYWISPSGRSAIAYRVLHSIALTVTGPIGDLADREDCVRGFMRFCSDHSWTPAFYAVHDDERAVMENEGCSAIRIGTEMVVIPADWQTRGKKWQDIRTAINKAGKTGITDMMTTFDAAPDSIRHQIIDISEQWAEMKSLPEMHFTLGGVDELMDPRVMLLVAVDAEGTVQGVTSWLPTYRDGNVVGWTLDFMRHRPDSPNGIMEFLIARMAERLRDQGEADPANAVGFMSLSTAPLAGLNPDDGSGSHNADIITHALTMVSDMLEPAYGFKSLYAFKHKFHPLADPVYVCMPDNAKMPALALAVTEAYVPSMDASQIIHVARTLVKPSTA